MSAQLLKPAGATTDACTHIRSTKTPCGTVSSSDQLFSTAPQALLSLASRTVVQQQFAHSHHHYLAQTITRPDWLIATSKSDTDMWLHLPYSTAVPRCLQNADYSPELTGLLNQQATWQMLELQPQLKQLLGGSAVKVAPASNVGKRTEAKNIGVPSKNLRSSAGGASCGGWRSAVAAFAAAVFAHVVIGA
jgi:hypothetical protein